MKKIMGNIITQKLSFSMDFWNVHEMRQVELSAWREFLLAKGLLTSLNLYKRVLGIRLNHVTMASSHFFSHPPLPLYIAQSQITNCVIRWGLWHGIVGRRFEPLPKHQLSLTFILRKFRTAYLSYAHTRYFYILSNLFLPNNHVISTLVSVNCGDVKKVINKKLS